VGGSLATNNNCLSLAHKNKIITHKCIALNKGQMGENKKQEYF
jgi:hypothetical protein